MSTPTHPPSGNQLKETFSDTTTDPGTTTASALGSVSVAATEQQATPTQQLLKSPDLASTATRQQHAKEWSEQLNIPADLQIISPTKATLAGEELPAVRRRDHERAKLPDRDHEKAAGGSDLNVIAPHHGASFLSTVFNISCVMTGTGMLNLPRALEQSGWMGLVVLLIAAVASAYAGTLSIKCLYMSKDGRRLVSYGDTAREAWGRGGEIIVDIFQKVSAFGVCTIFLVLSGDFFANLANVYEPRLTTTAARAVVACGVLIPSLMLRNMKESVWIAVLGLAASLVVMVIIVTLCLTEVQAHQQMVTHHLFRYTGLASTGASVGFSFAATAIYPQVEQSMTHKRKFPLALATSILLACLVYTMVGVAGYVAFGDAVQSPILSNSAGNKATLVANAIILLHVVMTYPIIFTAVVAEIEVSLGLAQGVEFIRYVYRWLLRLTIWGITFALACLIPYFAIWIEIIGSSTNSAICWMIPVLLYFTLEGWRCIPTKHLICGSLVLLWGIAICVCGTFFSVKALVDELSKRR